MWIVRLALRRPYTFVVMAILILLMGTLDILRTPTDIFPNIDIPVVSIIWSYNGLVPEDMADRIVSVTERALTTTVDNIEHIESQSLAGPARMLRQTNEPTELNCCCAFSKSDADVSEFLHISRKSLKSLLSLFRIAAALPTDPSWLIGT